MPLSTSKHVSRGAKLATGLATLCCLGCGGSNTAPNTTTTTTTIPAAQLTFEGASDGIRQPDGSFAFPLTGRNVGQGCASQISGDTDFSAGPAFLTTLHWTIDQTLVVGQNQTFTYTPCCLAADLAARVTTYITRFTFQSVACR